MTRAEIVAKLQRGLEEMGRKAPSPWDDIACAMSEDLTSIADALQQEQRELVRVRDEILAPKRGGPYISLIPEACIELRKLHEWADVLTKVIGDGK